MASTKFPNHCRMQTAPGTTPSRPRLPQPYRPISRCFNLPNSFIAPLSALAYCLPNPCPSVIGHDTIRPSRAETARGASSQPESVQKRHLVHPRQTDAPKDNASPSHARRMRPETTFCQSAHGGCLHKQLFTHPHPTDAFKDNFWPIRAPRMHHLTRVGASAPGGCTKQRSGTYFSWEDAPRKAGWPIRARMTSRPSQHGSTARVASRRASQSGPSRDARRAPHRRHP